MLLIMLYTKSMHNPEAVLTIDIGGTKIAYALFRHPLNEAGTISPFYSASRTTPKGKRPLVEAVDAILAESEKLAEKENARLHPVVSIGSPGMFVGENQSVIFPGTAHNLEAYPGEFDHCDLKQLIESHINGTYQVSLHNDALAQMAGGIFQICRDPSKKREFAGQKIAYIGPGTGLGGGFARLDSRAVPRFYSDGHVSDLVLDSQDESGKSVRAETVFCGKAFEDITGISAKEAGNSDRLLETHRPVLEKMGRYLGQIMEKIYQGDIRMYTPGHHWPEADVAMAKGTTIFLLGGSMSKGPMGHILYQSAITYLGKTSHPFLTLIRIPDTGLAPFQGSYWLATEEVRGS